jgi:hypothetical protein
MTPDDADDAAEETDGDTNGAAPVPAPLQEFAAELMAGDEVRYEFDEAVIDVPSRFDRASPTATWRFDGTLTVRVNRVDE